MTSACGSAAPLGGALPDALLDAPVVAATATSTPFVDGACSGAFVAHDLPHITAGAGDTSSTFDGTGTGVALGDLDGDGDLDIVAPNLSGDTNLLFNEGLDASGAPSFRVEPLIVGRFRQAAIVDVDGDRDADIVLSTGVGPPTLFDNTGSGDPGTDPTFERIRMDGVDAATYAFAWSDLGGDGDLDLVTGSYNAELTLLRNSPVLGSDTGVVVHEQAADGTFAATRVASSAQALSVLLLDLDGDFDTDIAVGNDLATPDGLWVDNDGGWLEVSPFERTSFSTMSLDAGDVDNDGDLDLFSTDMKPRADDPTADERYVEVNADMDAIGEVDEVQRPENVLSLSSAEGGFENVAPSFGIDATGWSWSGLFGDLDSDGLLDLYIVTGMRSDNLFAALDDNELIEPNQAFVNTGDAMERRPEWGLDDLTGGRGMAMGDVDGDGDLDIVVNNLNAPMRLFENQICGGANLEIALDWAGSRNPSAIGATVIVEAGGERFTRTIDQSRGYLSGGPPTAHVGLGDHAGNDAADPIEVTVLWPDGTTSAIEGVEAGSRIVIARAIDTAQSSEPVSEPPSESGG